MKISGYSRRWESPVYLFLKKHFCPTCHTQLRRVSVSKIVNSGSAEARKYDFSFPGGGFMRGNVKFIWTEFRCPDCGQQFTIKEMKKIEEQNGK